MWKTDVADGVSGDSFSFHGGGQVPTFPFQHDLKQWGKSNIPKRTPDAGLVNSKKYPLH